MHASVSNIGVALATGTLLALALPGAPAADGVSFKDKTIQLGIGSDPGGGTDRAGRLLAQYMEKHLPGNPTVSVRNFGAGGGKIRAANYLALQAPKDGSFFLQADTTPLRPDVVKRKVSRYDPRKFRPIGAINRGGSIILVRKQAMPRLEDAKADPVIVGAISGTRRWQIMLTTGKAHLGWNLRWIPGYKGTSAMVQALRQGEIDVIATHNAYIIDELVKDGVVELVAQEGQVEGGKYVPRVTYPNVPIFPDMLAATNPPKVAIQGLDAVLKPGAADKWAGLPEGTPEDIVQAYRAAFAKMAKDPEFLKVAKKQLSPEIYYVSGEDVEQIIRDSLDVSEEAIKYATTLRKKYGLSAR